jgi:hypothetical protein
MREGSSSRLVPARLALWMQQFSEGFTAPTWEHVLVLIVGSILTRGARSVATFFHAAISCPADAYGTIRSVGVDVRRLETRARHAA